MPPTTKSRSISFDLELVINTVSSHGSFLVLRLDLGLEDIATMCRRVTTSAGRLVPELGGMGLRS